MSQVWQQFVFTQNICFGLLALISAVLAPNNVTRLTWQLCARGIDLLMLLANVH